MALLQCNFVDLDVDKLFEERSIEDIIQIERILEAEIEKKRNELRGMVGDRYKDVLVASDAIKSMRDISAEIVTKIDDIKARCKKLVQQVSISTTVKAPTSANQMKIEERSLVIQIRLIMAINSQIWAGLDSGDYLTAVQLCLLAQYIHAGLQLLPQETLSRLPILKTMKSDIEALRGRILKKVKEKLQTLELDSKETSRNLIALMFLRGQTSQSLDTFMDIRKSTLKQVIVGSHDSVRLQVTAMIKCLMTTIRLLHDCFISFDNEESGLIWQQLNEIIGPDAPTTLTKVELPSTPLLAYIPEILKEYKPVLEYSQSSSRSIKETVENWLEITSKMIKEGLAKPLALVTSVRGLHIIREDALRIAFPDNWGSLCETILLPSGFHVWYNFFQVLVTERAKEIITKKVGSNSKDIRNMIADSLTTLKDEKDLRAYVWTEEFADISQVKNNHIGLSMKTKGFSPNIIKLCSKIDEKYLEILQDLSLYLCGIEYEDRPKESPFNTALRNRKFIDRVEIEKCIGKECVSSVLELRTWWLNTIDSCSSQDNFVQKSVFLARFLQAVGSLCPHLTKCCNYDNQWSKLMATFSSDCIKLWSNWVHKCVQDVKKCTEEKIVCSSTSTILDILPKWDTIQIQEEGEDGVFASNIRVPFQPCFGLQNVMMEVGCALDEMIPHTVPRRVHLQLVEAIAQLLLQHYDQISQLELGQTLALQFLFDVKFLTTLLVPRENLQLISVSQTVCDRFRVRIDPFDLDVFYKYLQANVKQCVLQKQLIFGCLLPNATQLSSVGVLEKNKNQESDPSVLALSIPSSNSWFQLLPIPSHVQKTVPYQSPLQKDLKKEAKGSKHKKSSSESMRSGAAAFFGAVTNDWFS